MAPVVADNPVAGDQLYVCAPLAVSDTLPPLQNAAGVAGLTFTFGIAFTITVTVC